MIQVRIGVVSDIHGDYQRLVGLVKAIQPLDLLIHAGDGAREVQRLSTGFPTLPIRAVIGNCDLFAYGRKPSGLFVQESFFTLRGWNVFLTHGHTYSVKTGLSRIRSRARQLGSGLVIFGHTHLPLYERDGDLILLNPGSLSLARCYGKPSYRLLELTEKEINGEILYLN